LLDLAKPITNKDDKKTDTATSLTLKDWYKWDMAKQTA